MTKDFVKTNMPGFLKDKKTNVVINTNYNDYLMYKAQQARSKKVNNLETQMTEIQNNLQKIVAALGLKNG